MRISRRAGSKKSVEKEVKILFSGDRDWTDIAAVRRAFDHFQPTHVIEGGQRGLDVMSGAVAKERGIPLTEMKADWTSFGPAAGPIRNGQMLDLWPDKVVAFHNNYKKSKGTRNCVDQALKREIEVWMVTSEHILRMGKKKNR